VARRAAAKARHESKAKPDNGDSIPMGDDDWQKVSALIIEADTCEIWVLRAVQHLGLVGPETKRLTDVRPGVLQEIVNRWDKVLTAAQQLENAVPAAVA
jgi:hypothetical protein